MTSLSTCIKTGAVVYLAQYNEHIITDLMELGDVYHFLVWTENHVVRGKPDMCNLVVHEVSTQRKVGRECLAHKDYCSRFVYEGFPLTA